MGNEHRESEGSHGREPGDAAANERWLEALTRMREVLSQRQPIAFIAASMIDAGRAATGASDGAVALEAGGFAEVLGDDDASLAREIVQAQVEGAEVVWLGSPAALAEAHPKLADRARASGVEAALVAPLVLEGRVHGRLALVFDRARSPSSADRRGVELLAWLCTHALDRGRVADLSEQAQAVAEQSARARDELLALVSHELRTPLAALTMWTHALRTAEGQARTTAIAAIERSAREQSRLIEDLLDVARGMRGKLSVRLEPVDVRQSIAAAVEPLRAAAEAKSIRLDTHLPELGSVIADEGRLRQMVQNLLSNAIRFTPPGGAVHVRLEDTRDRVIVRVEDTGIGFGSEQASRLFLPFLQDDSTTTRHHGGLGIGLTLVRCLADLHGGAIEAESRGEGLGSTFSLTLRKAKSARPASTPPAADGERGGAAMLRGVRVLIVEDDELTRRGVAAVLEQRGARVETAASALAGFAALSASSPDVLLCDIAMPGEDGYSFIRRVRARGGAPIPAAALTAQAGSSDRARAIAAGFDVHVGKPVDPERLVMLVASLAGRA